MSHKNPAPLRSVQNTSKPTTYRLGKSYPSVKLLVPRQPTPQTSRRIQNDRSRIIKHRRALGAGALLVGGGPIARRILCWQKLATNQHGFGGGTFGTCPFSAARL